MLLIKMKYMVLGILYSAVCNLNIVGAQDSSWPVNQLFLRNYSLKGSIVTTRKLENLRYKRKVQIGTHSESTEESAAEIFISKNGGQYPKNDGKINGSISTVRKREVVGEASSEFQGTSEVDNGGLTTHDIHIKKVTCGHTNCQVLLSPEREQSNGRNWTIKYKFVEMGDDYCKKDDEGGDEMDDEEDDEIDDDSKELRDPLYEGTLYDGQIKYVIPYTNLQRNTCYRMSVYVLYNKQMIVNTPKSTTFGNSENNELMEVTKDNVKHNSTTTKIQVFIDPQESYIICYHLGTNGTGQKATDYPLIFDDMKPESTHNLTLRYCKIGYTRGCSVFDKCGKPFIYSISTEPLPPKVPEVLHALVPQDNGNLKLELPKVGNPPASQYVVVIENLENLEDEIVKNRSLEIVKEYIASHEPLQRRRRWIPIRQKDQDSSSTQSGPEDEILETEIGGGGGGGRGGEELDFVVEGGRKRRRGGEKEQLEDESSKLIQKHGLKTRLLQSQKRQMSSTSLYQGIHPRSKRQAPDNSSEINGWVAGKILIGDDDNSTHYVELGNGQEDNKPLDKDKGYKLVVVTEKRSGTHRKFSVTQPINVKEAASSALIGILFGAVIFLGLILLFVWTYKKNQEKIIVRAPNTDQQMILPENVIPQRKSLVNTLSRKLSGSSSKGVNLNGSFRATLKRLKSKESQESKEQDVFQGTRIPIANAKAYLQKAIESEETETEFNDVPMTAEKSCTHGEHAENRLKNRDINILPYNETRVKLPRLLQNPFSDYINASIIQGHLHPDAYIAAQGPKDCDVDTVDDFWRMIWHSAVQTIVMVSADDHAAGGEVKVVPYWPKEDAMTKGGLEICMKASEDKGDFIVRTFIITTDEETREVAHYQYTAWQNHGLPQSPFQVAKMIKAIRSKPKTRPTVVHCCSGVGNTGVILLAMSVLDQIDKYEYLDIPETLKTLRDGRASFVENIDQYRFAYRILQEYLFADSTEFPPCTVEHESES